MPNQHNRDSQRTNREKLGHVDNPKENQEPAKIEKKPRRKAYITNQVFRWITLTVDVLVFFAVAIYSFFAYQQWQATSDAVKSADSNARLDERAWVTITKASLKLPLADGQTPVVKLELRNSGKSPALKVHVNGASYWSYTPNSVSGISPSEAIIGPDSNWHTDIPATEPLNAPTLESIQHGGTNLYVSGTVTYTDIFKRQHQTDFCMLIKGADLGEGILGACPSGNRVDE